jgi:hypothetical protein
MSNFDGYFCFDRWGNIGLVTDRPDKQEYCTFSIAHNVDRLRKLSSIVKKATLEEIRLAGFEGVGCKNADEKGKEAA